MTIQTGPQTIALVPDGPIIPALGVGAWSWGDSLFWSYGQDYGVDQVREAFHSMIKVFKPQLCA